VEIYEPADLAARLPKAEILTPSAPRQAGTFTDLAHRFHEHRTGIPEDAELLLEQLGTFGIHACTQPPRFGKMVSGGTDDSVYGLGWAVGSCPEESRGTTMFVEDPEDGWVEIGPDGVQRDTDGNPLDEVRPDGKRDPSDHIVTSTTLYH